MLGCSALLVAAVFLSGGHDERQLDLRVPNVGNRVIPEPATDDSGDPATASGSDVLVSPSSDSADVAQPIFHEPDRVGTAYLDARDEAETRFRGSSTGLQTLRTRIVQLDPQAIADYLTGAANAPDRLGDDPFMLSRALDLTLFPDLRCTVDSVEYASVPRSGNVLAQSHCREQNRTRAIVVSNLETGRLSISILASAPPRNIEHQLASLGTGDFALVFEFDPLTRPRASARE